MLYYAQFYSHLSYGVSVWGSMIKNEKRSKISKLQRKTISLLNLKANIDSIIMEEKILSFDQIVKIELLKIGHRLSTNTLRVTLPNNLKQDHLLKSLR